MNGRQLLPQEPSGAHGFSSDEIERYSRHLLLPQVGLDGQRQLKNARVLLIGAGGLGSPVALYLAAAGVGTVGLVDVDNVELSNLQRQVMFGVQCIGQSKLKSALRRIKDLNPHVNVELHEVRFSVVNAVQIAQSYDLIIDGTDNFATRYLVNDVCVLLGKPNIYGSVYRFEGQASVFATPNGPCYRCIFRAPPPIGLVPSCAEGGVLGVLPGLIGTIQATEALKTILGFPDTLAGRLLLVDAETMSFRKMKLTPDPDCPVCGVDKIVRLPDESDICGIQRNDGADGSQRNQIGDIDASQLAAKIDRGDSFDLLDVREPGEWAICRIPGAQLIPLRTLAERISSFDPTRECILYCKGGTRSLQAAQQLARAGFTSVKNLRGGILAWREEIDPTIPRY